MTNSATSTSARADAGRTEIKPPSGSGFHAWHFFTLFSMVAATVVVVVSRDTHPAALLLLSAAVICAGFVGLALSRAVAGFFTGGVEALPLPIPERERMIKEKALVVRSIKELEFDKAMGKVSEGDFASISAQLRARALVLMQDLDRNSTSAEAKVGREDTPASVETTGKCGACGTVNDADARFCKSCGQPLERGK